MDPNQGDDPNKMAMRRLAQQRLGQQGMQRPPATEAGMLNQMGEPPPSGQEMQPPMQGMPPGGQPPQMGRPPMGGGQPGMPPKWSTNQWMPRVCPSHSSFIQQSADSLFAL